MERWRRRFKILDKEYLDSLPLDPPGSLGPPWVGLLVVPVRLVVVVVVVVVVPALKDEARRSKLHTLSHLLRPPRPGRPEARRWSLP